MIKEVLSFRDSVTSNNIQFFVVYNFEVYTLKKSMVNALLSFVIFVYKFHVVYKYGFYLDIITIHAVHPSVDQSFLFVGRLEVLNRTYLD